MKKFKKKLFVNTDIIRKYLFDNSLSKRKFCKISEIKLRNLRSILKNSSKINLNDLIKIQNVIDITIDKLMII